MANKGPNYIHLVIGVVIFVVLRFVLGMDVCVSMGLTPVGASALSLFITTIYLWITFGTGWISLVSIALLGYTGIAPAATILANSFGNSTTVVIIATLLLSVALDETGVTKLIANWFISRNFVNNRPYAFFAMFFLATMIVAWFVVGTATAVIFVTLGMGIIKSLGYEKGDKFAMALILGAIWSVVIGMAATPIGHPIVLAVLSAAKNITGISISWVSYMIVGIPFSLVCYVIMLLFIKFIIRPDVSKFNAYDAAEYRQHVKPLDKKGTITSVVYVVLIIVWLFPDIFGGILPDAAAFVKAGGEAIPALLAFTILCAAKVEGKPILNYKDALSKISWPLVFFIATIFLYASVISMQTGGINVFLKALVAPLSNSVEPLLLVALFLFLVILLTNFFSNAVTGSIGVTVCAPILFANPATAAWATAFAVLVAILCNFGIMTPGGSGFVAIAQEGGYVKSGDLFKYGAIYCIFVFIVTMVIFWPLALMIF